MSDSGNISIDHEGVRQRLRQAQEAGREQLAAHLAQVPDFAPSAAGRDFESYGRRIAELLSRAHDTGRRHVDGVIDLAQAGLDQVEIVRGADDGFGEQLGGRR